MEDSHYDEFGNYIGPALSDSDVVSLGPRHVASLVACASLQLAAAACGIVCVVHGRGLLLYHVTQRAF